MSLPVFWSPQTRAVVQESHRRGYVVLVGRPSPQPPRGPPRCAPTGPSSGSQPDPQRPLPEGAYVAVEMAAFKKLFQRERT